MVIWRAWLTRGVFTIFVVVPFWIAEVAGEDGADGSGEATDNAAPMIEQLSPLNQIRVFTGLFTVIVLGLVIFLVIKAGAHMWRGVSAAANRLPVESVPSRDDWADKPLNETPTDSPPGKEEDDA